MANERRLNKSASRTPRHGSSTTTTIAASASSSGSGSSNGGSSTLNAISGGKKQSRQYRLPHPPVPHAQTSLLQSQRVPASVVAYPSARQAGYESPQVSDSRYYASQGGRGGGNQSQTTTSTAAGAERSLAPTTVNATDGSTEAAVPSADPDSMEAKKALNKWGALDSLSGSGTGTFGFGPLLFHHVDETPRDPYDTTNMMLNDPISFNPMSAISWARLDESPDSVDELDADQSSTAQKPDIAVAATAAAGTGGSSRQDGSSSSHAGYVDSPASTPASPRHGSGASYASDVSGSRTSSVAGSSVGNISRTFSDTSLVSPDTERSSAGVPPAFTSPPSSRTPHPHPSQQQQRQGSQAEVPVQYRTHQSQQQQQAYPTQKPTSSKSPTSHRAPAGHQPYTSESYTHTRPQQHAQHSNRHRHQQQQQQQQQTSQARQPQQPQPQLQQAPAPPPSLPAHQATTDFLLCLGPHCSARFPTEQELAAHYRAEHAFTCTWTSCSAASFTSSNALAWHVNAEHYLVCPVPGCCGAMFASKRALDGHLKVSRIDSSESHWRLFRSLVVSRPT